MRIPLKPAALFPLLLLVRCGYTGDPLPPALMIPQPVRDLEAHQQGSAIVLRFTLPERTTEDLLLKSPPEIELRAGPNPTGGFDMGRWLAGSSRIAGGEVREGRAEFRVPAAAWAGQEMVFAVRTAGPKGRVSEWSNLAVVRVVAPPQPPREVRAEGTPRGCGRALGGRGRALARLPRARAGTAARGGSGDARVARRGGAVRVGLRVRRAAGGGDRRRAGAERNVAGRPDRIRRPFPSGAPTGLRILAGPGAIELSWERNSEPDWKAYQVWRAENGGELVRLGEPLTASSFSDSSAVSGRRYRYAVSAIDDKGNESRPCEPVEIVAP